MVLLVSFYEFIFGESNVRFGNSIWDFHFCFIYYWGCLALSFNWAFWFGFSYLDMLSMKFLLCFYWCVCVGDLLVWNVCPVNLGIFYQHLLQWWGCNTWVLCSFFSSSLVFQCQIQEYVDALHFSEQFHILMFLCRKLLCWLIKRIAFFYHVVETFFNHWWVVRIDINVNRNVIWFSVRGRSSTTLRKSVQNQ